jgi:hypothetical protein
VLLAASRGTGWFRRLASSTTAATTATATTAVVIRISRSLAQLLTLAGDKRVIVPVHGGSRSASTIAVIAWFRVNNCPGRPETAHTPRPSSGASSQCRAVAITRPSYLAVCSRRRFVLPWVTPPSVVRSGKPVTIPVTMAPVNAGPRQYQPDSATALNCADVTQRDSPGRNERPW